LKRGRTLTQVLTEVVSLTLKTAKFPKIIKQMLTSTTMQSYFAITTNQTEEQNILNASNQWMT